MKGLNIMSLVKGGLIGGGVGLGVGLGLSVVKELKHKKGPESKELSIQTLNLDRAAPDLISHFVTLEEMVERIPADRQAAWRSLCTRAIQSCDRLYNILVMVQRKELRPELKHVGDVEVWARQAVDSVRKLQSLLPEQTPPPEGQENLFSIYQMLAKDVQENVQNAWLNFKNSV